MATCTSQAPLAPPPYLWDDSDTWDCAAHPIHTDDVILSNAGTVKVNGSEFAASIRWETLTGSRSFEIGALKTLTEQIFMANAKLFQINNIVRITPCTSKLLLMINFFNKLLI